MKNRFNGMWRSLVSLLMALCLVVGLVPTAAFATEEKYDIEDVKAALEEMSQLVAENYDEAYAQAYQYAVDNGYIAYANEGLDVAIAALEALDEAALLELAEQDPALSDEAATLKAEALDALKAAKALLNEADVLDQATLEDFLTLVNEGLEAYEALIALLDAAGVFAAIAEAYEYFVTEILPCINAKLQEAVKVGAEILLEKVNEKLAELDAAIAAQLEALKEKLEAAVAEIKAQIEAVKAELEAKLAELEAKLAELQAKLAELQAKLEELQAKLAELNEQLKEAVEEAKAAIEAAIAEVKAMIEEVKAMIEEVKAVIEEVKAMIEEVKAKIEEAVEALKELHKKLLALNEAIQALLTEGMAAFGKLQDALNDLIDEAAEVVAVVSAEAAAKLAEAAEAVKAYLNELYYNATHGEYTITKDSYYIALGDSTAVSASYVDVVAATMADIAGREYKFNNLSEDGLMIQDTYAVLEENADEIAKADLITLGYGNNGFTQFALSEVIALINEEASAIDWADYVGAEGMPYVEQIKAELYNTVLENVGDAEAAALVATAAEAYAYSYVAYTCNLPEVVNAIHAINPEALVVVVGMYNPLDNVVLDMEGAELNIGDYIQYMVDASNVSALAFAMLTQDAVYVDAPAVEVKNTKTVLSAANLISEVLYYQSANLNPTEAGHAYIAEQIINALTITVEEIGLLGDADNNGVVNTLDALLVLQYYTGAVTADEINLAVCDLDGNGVVNTVDALLILQYYTGAIEKFPVEG